MLDPRFASLGIADCMDDVNAQKARIGLYLLHAMEQHDEVEQGTLADIVLNSTLVLNGVRVTPRNVGLLIRERPQDIIPFCVHTYTVFSLPYEKSKEFLSIECADSLRDFHYPPNIHHHLVDLMRYYHIIHQNLFD
ncbi:hypothetical protein D6774_03995 [Candidatus Woesearchaeota archaeon]|nr:MAG: hypothetical protein D6774_03995 [Candidatus Woesearchaeota archaeon]